MPRAIPRIDELPPILAAPLAEYAKEADPRLALWAACDAVEMTLRLAVALGLGDWARAGGVPAALRLEVSRRLEQPTLGRWRGMALALAAQPAPATPLGDLWAWLTGTLEPLLVAGDPSTSLTELRNRLAHGGGVAHGLATELLAAWAPRLGAAFGALAGLADLRLVAPCADVVLGADDPGARARATAWAAGRALPVDAVVAVRGEHVLPLWPLVAYASPSGEPRAVPQVYVRRGEVRLVMTPLGAERAAVAESSAAAVDALLGAGLLGEPPARPPVELEIPGFEAELKRDAGQCVGRDAEVAAVAAAVAGPPGLAWLWGAAGSGKSLVCARAVHGGAALAFRFRAGDGRCTRETFLRFVVERAAQAAGAAPPKGKPLREQARELCGAARVPIVVDGVDDLADPGFVGEVLAVLAKVTRVVAVGRPDAAVAAAMRAAGAVDVFADGLPATSAADVRAMLLDKIGPLSKRLVALDRDAGGDVVNPFIEAVVARAGGLPVYVSYVIGDLLAGRVRTLDGAALPPSLGAYHAAVLRRGGAGAAQQLVTPLVATLALIREPLEAPALHALLVHRLLATDDDLGRAAVADALAQLAGMLRREDRDDNGLPEFVLFHPTLRDHVLAAPDQAMAVATARLALARAARELVAGPAARYLEEHGVAHLVEGGDLDGAAAALAWPRLLARLGRGGGFPAVLADLRLAAAAAPDRRAGAVPLAELYAFVRGAAHHVERGGALALVQAALADGDDSPISAAAAAALGGLRPIRRVDRPARSARGARQRTMMGHAAGVRALAVAGDAVVSASADGTMRVWDAADGSALRTLAPPLTTMASTTRAAAPAAAVDLAGAMPVLGVHAVAALPGGVVVAAHGDGVVRAWQLDPGVVVAEARIRTYGWALAVTGARVAVACDDGALRLLDARTLAPVAEARPAAATSGDGPPYLAAVVAVGGVLVVAGASRGLSVLDPTSLTALGELRGPGASARALAAVPGTTQVVSAHRDGSLALWDVVERRLLARVDVPGGAHAVAVAGAVVLVGTRAGTLVRVALPELTVGRSAPVHAGPVAAVVALADGRAVTAGDDKAVRLVDLDVAAAARPSHAGAITALATPGGGYAITAGADGAVKIWEAARGRSLRTIPAHPGGVAAVAAHLLADGVAVFSAAGVTVTEHRFTTAGTAASQPLPPAPAPVVALVARSPDELLAACADGGVRAWRRADGWQPPAASHDGSALAVAAWGARSLSGGSDGLLRVGGDAPASWRGHAWEVHAVAVGGDTLVSASRDGAAIVWDPAAGTPRLSAPRHGGTPRCLAVSPDGARIATASRDDCVVVWTPDGAEQARWTHDAPPCALAFADARTLVVADAAGEITVLELPPAP